MSSDHGRASESHLECAMYLDSGSETVFALHTAPAPTTPASSVGVVLAHSGANNFSAHRNGVWTSISRRLAQAGIPSLRFDFAGTGESSGDLVLGVTGQPVSDVVAAMNALRSAGCQALLIVGSCFGAIPSIAAAAGRGDVAGLVLFSPPLVLPGRSRIGSVRERIAEVINLPTARLVVTNGDYRRWFFARLVSIVRTRVSVKLQRLMRRSLPTPGAAPGGDAGTLQGLLMEDELARLITSETDIEVVYGTADRNLAQVAADADASRAIALLRRRGPGRLAWTVLDGPVHGLEDVAVQEQLVQLVLQRACGLNEPTRERS